MDAASLTRGKCSGLPANTNSVYTLDKISTNDPASVAGLEVHREKINELILLLRRE